MENYYLTQKQTIEDIYERDKKLLTDNYNTGVANLDKSKTAAEEMTAVTRERMLKYLPQQMRAQGINTQGVSEDALIKAHNNYQNTMADITANYDTQKNTLESEKSRGEVELSDKKDSALLTLEKEKRDEYEKLFTAANSGNYTADAMHEFAIKQGFSGDEASELANIAKKLKYEQLFEEANSGKYTEAEMLTLAGKQGFEGDEASELANIAKNKTIEKERDNFYSVVAGNLNKKIEDALSDGVLRESEYNDMSSYIDENTENLGESYAELLKLSLGGYEKQVKSDDYYEPDFSKVSTRNEWNGVAGEYATNEEFRIEIGEDSYDLTTGAEQSASDNTRLTQTYKENNGGAAPSVGSMIADGNFIHVYLKNEKDGYSWFAIRKRDNEYADFLVAMGLAGTQYDYKSSESSNSSSSSSSNSYPSYSSKYPYI